MSRYMLRLMLLFMPVIMLGESQAASDEALCRKAYHWACIYQYETPGEK